MSRGSDWEGVWADDEREVRMNSEQINDFMLYNFMVIDFSTPFGRSK